MQAALGQGLFAVAEGSLDDEHGHVEGPADEAQRRFGRDGNRIVQLGRVSSSGGWLENDHRQ